MIWNWIFWTIPPEYLRRYFITLWFVLFFLPGVFLGVRLTIFGIFLNFLWYDIIFYCWLRFKERMEGEE
tara:strand:+ start:405 stop:611 length:207 start_codon:yes stop_codon:yes gene_type:complete